ncbi:hypothetical protein [Enterovibrio norvegicus]|uniref:hypothetical protein n=1 Tax=Enterovibrio norvegicus TaxID=188144 RepID=UPI0035535DFD
MKIIYATIKNNFLFLILATIISGAIGQKFIPELREYEVYEGYLFITPTFDGYGDFRNPKPPLDKLTKNLTEDMVFALKLVNLLKDKHPELLHVKDPVTLYHKIKERIDIKRINDGLYMVKTIGDIKLYRESMDIFKESLDNIYQKTVITYIDSFKNPNATCYHFDGLCSSLLAPYLELASIVENRGLYSESEQFSVTYVNNNKVRLGLFFLFSIFGFSIVFIAVVYRNFFGVVNEQESVG